MNFFDRFTNAYQKYLPSPFTIAVLLTIFTFLFALIFSKPDSSDYGQYSLDLLLSWESGLWQEGSGGLYFAFQMMLILILGHVLALTPFFSKIINYLLRFCTNTATSAFVITITTILMGLFNWGLGLIFGAILARKIGEKFAQNNQPLNYPLIGACGYVGMMVWHGGISGSAPTKAAENGNLASFFSSDMSILSDIPASISISETIFSPMNIFCTILILLVLPTVMYFIGKKSKTSNSDLPQPINLHFNTSKKNIVGAEWLDYSKVLPILLGSVVLFIAFYKSFILPDHPTLKVITPNFLNFIMLGLGILMHGSITNFINAVDQAIKGASGILIQFPLYFGIMAMMNHSGMVQEFSNYFIAISTPDTLPIFTYISAGIVNVFVPSGGGQWIIQGPIIIQAAQDLGVSYSKIILALSYGDQLTNMLQPFWALPLLGITQLKARQILPYTLLLFLIGGFIFLISLLLF